MGESGSGKDSIVKEVCQQYNMTSVVSYTTRQKRVGESGTHIFVTLPEFMEIQNKVACSIFNGNYYCATQEQVDNADFYVIDVEGVKQFKQNYQGNKQVHVIYLTASERTRMTRMIKRGDTPENAQSRIDHDRVAFAEAKDIADVQFDNYYFMQCTEAVMEYVRKEMGFTFPNSPVFSTIVYISHPFNGEESNLHKIENAILKLHQIFPNIMFVSPVHSFGYLYQHTSYEVGLEYCLWLLDKCDEMWVLGDFETSKGCNMEIEYCKEQKIPYKIIEE